ncbi:MAG TPA: hypothetical protein VHQ03_00415 [Candidatus Dormibacteraeota bacterium]|nr:hypothetical protein [Candidatus Dormibacteraeota bacterium]
MVEALISSDQRHMTNRWLILGCSVVVAPLPAAAGAQWVDSAAIPEMTRLARAFAGDWNSVEVVQYGKAVPQGEGRRGTMHIRLAGGGTALVSEGHTTGRVGGNLRWLITIWWDPNAKYYRLLTCFKAPSDAGCHVRGTAHWDGDTFVNDYEEAVEGKRTMMRDLWTDIAPNSHTLTEAHDTGDGVLRPYVVSRNTRQ